MDIRGHVYGGEGVRRKPMVSAGFTARAVSYPQIYPQTSLALIVSWGPFETNSRLSSNASNIRFLAKRSREPRS